MHLAEVSSFLDYVQSWPRQCSLFNLRGGQEKERRPAVSLSQPHKTKAMLSKPKAVQRG